MADERSVERRRRELGKAARLFSSPQSVIEAQKPLPLSPLSGDGGGPPKRPAPEVASQSRCGPGGDRSLSPRKGPADFLKHGVQRKDLTASMAAASMQFPDN